MQVRTSLKSLNFCRFVLKKMNIDYHNTRDDALTEVLDALQIEGRLYCVNDMKTPWAIEEVWREQIYFYVIEHGSGQIKFKNRGQEEIRFASGDLLLIAGGEEHIIYNGTPADPILNSQIFGADEDRRERHYLRIEGGGDEATIFICGAFFFKYRRANALLAALPPFIHIRRAEHDRWLRPALEMLSHEAREVAPGAGSVINRLTEIVFVQAIRFWIKTQSGEQTGWLAALKDDQIGRALNLLHQNPAKNWTVAGLAAEVGMSRSPFATRFSRLVGEPPLKYLTKWRLDLAAIYLRTNELNVGEIAEKVGYDAVAAFSKNFRKAFGLSPSEFRRKHFS
jgi:AraC-like DNA-binding protein